MNDEFDAFLASSLGVPEREPDRDFVRSVQARILLDERYARERRTLLANFVEQLAAVISFAVAAWMITWAAPITSWFGHSPSLALAVLLSAFAFFLLLIGRTESEPELPSGL